MHRVIELRPTLHLLPLIIEAGIRITTVVIVSPLSGTEDVKEVRSGIRAVGPCEVIGHILAKGIVTAYAIVVFVGPGIGRDARPRP